ncbi:hypothetical protein KIPB_012567 [Kipferlia bialata]|uniref:Uncharacterized protein n=1 Tax=Kipferlia bialata TaxID=797122 RepID=A0A9K3D8A8_9EUKA|nr:hypothetical protein KIPB_012567 [Kipferlia bialata]|eukprot:g12567.t1
MHTLCKEAAMHPLRRFVSSLDDNLDVDVDLEGLEGSTPEDLLRAGVDLYVHASDIQQALGLTRPSVAGSLKAFSEFQRRVGSGDHV